MTEERTINPERIILDTKGNKYKLMPLILRWARELKHKQESAGNPSIDMTLLIDQAAAEIISGKVKESEIENLPTFIPSVSSDAPILTLTETKKDTADKTEKKDDKKKKGKKK